MRIPLPPKRFQSVDDPRFDPIRHRPWFRHLAQRRDKLPRLKNAYNIWRSTKSSQIAAAKNWGVHERELRDYANFVEGRSRKPITEEMQLLLDWAASDYCTLRGMWNLTAHIAIHAERHMLDARPIVELWEVDPNFWPTGYSLTKPKEEK